MTAWAKRRGAAAVASVVLVTACPLPPPLVTGDGSSTSEGVSETAIDDEPVPASCRALPPDSGSGVYRIDPDGAGAREGFDVYCDMETQGGGWILIAEIGAMKEIGADDLDTDRMLGLLLDGVTEPDDFSTLDTRAFDAYGDAWTVRSRVDVYGDDTFYQFTFFRSRAGEGITPGQVGSNWWHSDTPSRVEYLVAASGGKGQNNTTWLVPLPYDDPIDGVPEESEFYLFGLRDEQLAQPCLDASGQTQPCHFLAGMLNDEDSSGQTGTATAQSNYGDGVTHSWGHAGTYWLRDDRLDRPQAD